MDNSTNSNRLRRLLKIIQFIHHNPGTKIGPVLVCAEIVAASFFRFMHVAKILGVQITFDKEKGGYIISDYGILNKKML